MKFSILRKFASLSPGTLSNCTEATRRVRLSSRAPFIRSSTAPLTQFVVDCPRLHGPIAAARGDGASIGRTSHAQNLSARGQRLAQSQTSRVPKFDLAGFVPISVAGNQPA